MADRDPHDDKAPQAGYVAVPGWPDVTIPPECAAGVAANLTALSDHVGLVRAALARIAGDAL